MGRSSDGTLGNEADQDPSSLHRRLPKNGRSGTRQHHGLTEDDRLARDGMLGADTDRPGRRERRVHPRWRTPETLTRLRIAHALRAGRAAQGRNSYLVSMKAQP